MPKGGGTMYMSYDVENRLVSANGETYAYTSGNKRIWKQDASSAVTWSFYGAGGERIMGDDVYFGGKKIRSDGGLVLTDRLGSVIYQGTSPSRSSSEYGTARSYFPYGEERNIPSTTDNADKFGTYFRDAGTGLDYADQRYFSSSTGRFLSSDPYEASGGPGDPSSWNRNIYTRGDPVNRYDPTGLQDEGPPTLPTFGYCADGSLTFFGGSPCPAGLGNWGWNIGVGNLSIDFFGINRLNLPRTTTGTPDQAKKVGEAYRDAVSRLIGNTQCHDALSTAGAEATDTLENTNYRVVPFPDNPDAGASTNGPSDVFINATGVFFNTLGAGPVTLLIPSLTVDGQKDPVTFQSQAAANAFILLHELGHQTKRFLAYGGPFQSQINASNSWLVLENCFGMQRPVIQ